MAACSPPPPFHVQKTIDNPKAFAHHDSVSKLWSTRWQRPCSLGIYPFGDGKIEDFEPIFAQLVTNSSDNVSILSDPDAYAAPFLPVGENLVRDAENAEQKGHTDIAKDLYLRAAAVYRIARFPIIRSKLSRLAWELGKDAYIKGGKYLDPPNAEVQIPFNHANTAAGDKAIDIDAFLRIPQGEKPVNGWPVILFILGIDGYRPDYTERISKHTAAGFAVCSIDIPGTADCPASLRDPESPDRLFSSVLDWISTAGKKQYGFDDRKIIARGMSTGGYYSLRIAHTHATRLIASVSQGAWSHYALEPEWIRAMDHMEYPFALAEAFAYKFGYESVEEFIASNPKATYSLDDNGKILDKPSCRQLIINGLEDSIFPIEDSELAACRGRVKDVRFMSGRAHVGNPGADEIIYDWISEVVASNETEVKTLSR